MRRAVHEAGFSTHLRNDSVISGGAIDAFLGGTQRIMEECVVIGVARGADTEAHKIFATEMTGGDGYARFADEFAGRHSPRAMTIAEIGAMGIVSANAGNVLAAINGLSFAWGRAKERVVYMFDLTGKCALVTGASGGIGADIARGLHAAGAIVGLSGTRVAPLEALAAELGERAHILPCNLSDMEAVVALPKQAIEAMGSVDILVNNAGITRDNLFMRMSDEEWQSVLDVNLTATMKLCKGVIRGMMKARWGRIVNVSSIVGATGNPGQANYAASKAGMIAMGKSLAYEVASRGITVNAIAPGFIETAMTDKLTDDQKAGILGQVPAGRMGTPNEIAAAVIYLSSVEASYVTGATLHVNGGMAML